jgi:hypothetical protein
MAALSDPDRAIVWADSMRALPGPISITKADLRAAVNALDDFLEANQTAINNTIPQPARGALSTKQKAQLLMLVIERRYVFA